MSLLKRDRSVNKHVAKFGLSHSRARQGVSLCVPSQVCNERERKSPLNRL